jgi:hypothetical protein
MLIPPMEHYDPEVLVDGNGSAYLKPMGGGTSAPRKLQRQIWSVGAARFASVPSSGSGWNFRPRTATAERRLPLDRASRAITFARTLDYTGFRPEPEHVRAYYRCASVGCPWRSWIDLLAWEL